MADEAVTSEDGAVRLLVGEKGTGKTALIHDVAQRHGAAVAAINPAERGWRYSGLSALGTAMGGERAAAIDRLLEHADDWPEFAIAQELHRAIRAHNGERAPLLIDDVDELDGPSALVLSYVLGRAHGTGANVVATATRIDPASPLSGMEPTPLLRLSHDDSVAFARAVLGPEADRGVLDIVAHFSGGNPGAIARVRLTEHELTGIAPVPLPLRLIGDEEAAAHPPALASRAPAVAALLRALALAPSTARQAITERSAVDGYLLDDLIQEGVVEARGDRLRFSDPLMRLEVYASMRAEERQFLHMRAAEAHDGDPHGLDQWHASFLGEDADVAESLLTSAVEHAEADDALSAVEFAERALRFPISADRSDPLLFQLGDALARHGNFAPAKLYLTRASSSRHADRTATSAIRMLRVTYALDHTVDDGLIDSHVDSHAEDDPHDVARVLAEAARLRLRRGEWRQAEARITEAIAFTPGVIPRELRLTAQVCRMVDLGGADDLVLVDPRRSRRAPDAAHLGALPDVTATELVLFLQFLTLTEQYEASERTATRLLDRLPAVDASLVEEVRFVLALAAVRSGDHAAAADAVTRWERAAVHTLPSAAGTLLAAGTLALDPDHDTGVLARLIGRGHELCAIERNAAFDLLFTVLEGRLALETGNYTEAVDLLMGAAHVAAHPLDPSLVRCEADLVEALWMVGRRDEARERLTMFEEALLTSPSRWGTLALARARAVCAADREAFTAAFALHRASDSREERRALVAALARCHPTNPAVETAVATVAPVGYLTDDEQGVAHLVVRGLRNREIASALFLSQRTVELRLTRIYRKLGVRSRAQLVSMMLRER